MVSNNVTEINLCEFCGQPLPARSGRGRKTRFHPACNQISRSLTWIISELECVDLSSAACKRLRKQMFYIVNSHARTTQNRDNRGRFC